MASKLPGLTELMGSAEKYLRNSNKAINSIYGAASKIGRDEVGIKSAAERLDSVGSMSGGKSASTYTGKDAVRFGMATYAGASIAGRALSGGGAYKDSNGNFDIAGIPFI